MNEGLKKKTRRGGSVGAGFELLAPKSCEVSEELELELESQEK